MRRNIQPVDQRAEFLEALEDVLGNCDIAVFRKGEACKKDVTGMSWSPAGEIVASVRGGQPVSYDVVLSLQEFGRIDFDCTCPHGDRYWACCKHVAAVALLANDFVYGAAANGARQRDEWRVLESGLQQILESKSQNNEQFRTVWRVSSFSGYLEVFPYQQKLQGKRGTWSKGRKIGWSRFVDDEACWTAPGDRSIASKVIFVGGYSGYGSKTAQPPEPVDLMRELVGHPHVYWGEEPETRVTVREERPKFSFESCDSGAYRLKNRLTSFEQENDSQPLRATWGLICVDMAHDKILVVPCSRAETFLIEAFSKEIEIPAESAASIVKKLGSLAEDLEIEYPKDPGEETSVADARTHVLVAVSPDMELEVSFRVAPAGGDNFVKPGTGATRHVDWSEKGLCSVERDLVREREILEGTQSRLRDSGIQDPEESDPDVLDAGFSKTGILETTDGVWQIVDPDLTFEFIEALQCLPEDEAVVRWSSDKVVRVVPRNSAPAALRATISTRKDWFDLEGAVEVDGKQVQLQQVLASLRAGRRYVQVDGELWTRISDDLRARLQRLSAVVRSDHSTLKLDRTAIFEVEEALTGVAGRKVSKEWNALRKNIDESRAKNPRLPRSLQAKLRDYQIEGFRWLALLSDWGMGACLADDMGLGKTLQALAILLRRREEGPSLVIAPTSVGFNWVRECERFAPKLNPVLYRDRDRRKVLENAGPGDLIITSYGLALRDHTHLKEVEWNALVLDEAQNVKNSRTKRARAILSLQAKWRLALTGTPIENHLGELWSLFRVISPGLFGSWDRFRDTFARPIEMYQDAASREKLSRLVRPFMLRRIKNEVLRELPDRTESVLQVTLSPVERQLYDDTRMAVLNDVSPESEDLGEDKRFQILAALTRLRQIACHPRLIDPNSQHSSSKMELFLSTVDSLIEADHRALVFSQFVGHLTLAREELDARGIEYEYLDGGTSAKKRQVVVDKFQEGDVPLFLISLKAGGSGLNLTAADYVIHLDPWWNPAVEDQATDRAHRIGQTRPVTVYRLVSKDTIEERILELHAEKRGLIEGVLAGSGASAKLSTEELVELIRG